MGRADDALMRQRSGEELLEHAVAGGRALLTAHARDVLPIVPGVVRDRWECGLTLARIPFASGRARQGRGGYPRGATRSGRARASRSSVVTRRASSA